MLDALMMLCCNDVMLLDIMVWVEQYPASNMPISALSWVLLKGYLALKGTHELEHPMYRANQKRIEKGYQEKQHKYYHESVTVSLSLGLQFSQMIYAWTAVVLCLKVAEFWGVMMEKNLNLYVLNWKRINCI